MLVDHWMTFGTFAEQDHFEYPHKGAYRGVIINANMAAYAPAGLAAFLLEKKSPDTKYLIDPQTHAFQHDPGLISDSEGKPKRSIQKLADAYGAPVTDIVGDRPLLPRHFADKGLFAEFVRRCVDFQSSQIANYMKVSDAAKYMENLDAVLPPYASIAPYFYLTESTLDDWLPINVEAARLAVEYLGDKCCFAAVVVSQGILLRPNDIDQIVGQLSAIPLSGYLIWADNLDEQSAASAELDGLLRLARGLRANGEREVINLHGGYFSVLSAGALGENAMSGVAHGPEFGEYRSVVPVGGGIPISRYYIPNLHARVRYREALAMFQKMGYLQSSNSFHKNVCNCQQCVEEIGGNPANFTRFGEGTAKSVRRKHGLVRIEFPTMDAKLRCLRHYLQRKHREYVASSEANRDVLLENLRNGEAEFRDVAGLDGVAHLKLWRRVFGVDN